MIRAAVCLLSLVMIGGSVRNERSIIQALETRYRRASSFKATFYEQYSDGKSTMSAESGTVYFSKPGRMRWEYESPEQKLFIVDGTNVWFYVPADRTASRAKIADSSDWRTPLALLTGKSDLLKLCRGIEIVDRAKDEKPEDWPAEAQNSVLRCVPRRGSSDVDQDIREVLIESDPEGRLTRLIIRQPGNIETEFRFGNWEENLPISETKFHFDPPPGVVIVDESTLAGAMH